MCAFVQGSHKLLGRAYAEPEFKTVEQYYQKPHLHFFDVSIGKASAGELLAAFELIELDYSGFGEVTPVNQSTIVCCSFCAIFNTEDKTFFQYFSKLALIYSHSLPSEDTI